MATDNQKSPNVDWSLILKVAIAVLTAIAATLGAAKSDAVASFVKTISPKP